MNDFIKKVAYDIASYDHGYEEGYQAGLEEAAKVVIETIGVSDMPTTWKELEVLNDNIVAAIRNLTNQAKDEKEEG